jgi:hypothetical protein
MLAVSTVLGCQRRVPLKLCTWLYVCACVCCCRWKVLPLLSKACVLSSLLHAICWLREVVAVFAPGVGADVLGATAGTTSQAT